jgi:hypothetical protein
LNNKKKERDKQGGTMISRPKDNDSTNGRYTEKPQKDIHRENQGQQTRQNECKLKKNNKKEEKKKKSEAKD